MPVHEEKAFQSEDALTDTDPAFILFSSGTTGQPKGVVLLHRAVINNMKAIGDYLQPSAKDIFYIAKSMVHSSTITGEILLAIYTGASIIALNPLVGVKQTMRRIEEYSPSILCIPPSLLHFIANEMAGASRLASLRAIHVSGSIINKNDFRKVQEQLPNVRLYNGYGLTEAGPRVAQTCDATTFEFGSIGKPVQGVKLEIRKEDGVSPCDINETGELYVQSNAMMEGYWINGRADNSMLTLGWLATGDIGYRHASGNFVVTGRKDDMIITSAHNVFPHDVEEVLLQSNEVDDCIVFAVEDEVLGQRMICAYTSSANDAGKTTFNNKLRAWCGRQLAAYEVPKNFYHWQQIPVNANGKKSRAFAKKYLSEYNSLPHVSVVIPVYNQTPSLKNVLRFFNHQNYPCQRFEVIVVDDGSTEAVYQTIDSSAYNFKLVIERTINKGRASARNTGVSLAKGEIIVFCDADRIPGPQFIRSHVQFHLHTTGAAAFGCPWDCFLGEQRINNISIDQFSEIEKFSRKSAYYNTVSSLFLNGETNSSIAWAAFLVGNSSIRKSELLKAGGFDEDFKTWGFEHFELAMRLQQHGIRICHCEAASNYHIPHARDQQTLKQNIHESIALLSRKYLGANMQLLEGFVLGEIPVQEFEHGFDQSAKEKTERPKIKTENLKLQNI